MPHLEKNTLSSISYSPCKTHDRKANPLAVAGCWETQDHSDNFTRTFAEPMAFTELLPPSPSADSPSAMPRVNPLQKHLLFSIPDKVGNRHTFKCAMACPLVKTTLNCNTEEKSPDRIQPMATLELESCITLLVAPSHCALHCLLIVFNSHWQPFTPSGLI